MAVTRDILNSHPISNLRKEIAKTNIRGYSKMTKAQLVDVMMKHKERFSHIKPHTRVKKAPAPAPAPAPKKEKVPFKAKLSTMSLDKINKLLKDESARKRLNVTATDIKNELQKRLPKTPTPKLLLPIITIYGSDINFTNPKNPKDSVEIEVPNETDAKEIVDVINRSTSKKKLDMSNSSKKKGTMMKFFEDVVQPFLNARIDFEEAKTPTPKAPTPKAKTPTPKTPPEQKLVMLENLFGLTKAEANKMNPLDLFAKLPIIAKDNVEKGVGLKLETLYQKLKSMKGFKTNQFKDQLKKIQVANTNNKSFYRFRGNDMDRLVKNINRTYENSVSILTKITDYVESEIKRLKPEDEKAKARAEKRDKNKDTTKPILTNIWYYHFQHEDMPYDSSEYQSNIMDGYAYRNEIPNSEEGQMRLMERINQMEANRIRKSISTFIKGKKFKTASDAYEAYKKKMNEDNDYYTELDNMI